MTVDCWETCIKWQWIFSLFFALSPTRLLPDLTIWVTRRVSYQKQELLTLRDHLGSPPVFVIFLFYFLLQGPCSSSFKFSVFCCDFFILFVIVMCLVCPILLVSLDCPFLIGPSVFSNVYLQPKCRTSFSSRVASIVTMFMYIRISCAKICRLEIDTDPMLLLLYYICIRLS